jgi:hypothetical protein
MTATLSVRKMARKMTQYVASELAARFRVQDCPGWAAEALGFKVPRNVRPNPRPSPEGSANINILLRLLQETMPLPGDVAECGVFRGATLLPVGLYLRQAGAEKTLFGFDSFEGFDETINIDLQLGGREFGDKRVGGLNQTSFDTAQGKVDRLGLGGTVRLVKGYFENTLGEAADRRFSFVHLDCDIYQSYKTCLEFFYPRLEPGAIVLLDEYNDPPWPGCNKAVDEFLADKAETLCLCESDNHQKWYFRKR